MSYRFIPGHMYRMPTHFGPALGPRQGPDGNRYACEQNPRQVIVEAAFDADPAQLAELLPPGFEPLEPAQLVVSFAYVTEIEWLAGRGYNTFGVQFPSRFRGDEGVVQGDFLAVLWENRPEPIITGREELGFSKIYCELPPLERGGSTALRCAASWEGTTFAVLELTGLAPGAPVEGMSDSAGLLHYKYVPRTGDWGKADAEYAVLTPAAAPNFHIDRCERGAATMRFQGASWQAIPTLFREVSALSALRVGRCRWAQVLTAHGYKDLRDQRILK
jgi:hypothetical protein